MRSDRFEPAPRQELERERSVAHRLSMRSDRFEPAPRQELERERSVAQRQSLHSVQLGPATQFRLEQGNLVVRRLPPRSRRSAFASASAPYRAVPVTAESEGATVLASRSPNTLETTRLRRHSHSQSIQRRIVDSPS